MHTLPRVDARVAVLAALTAVLAAAMGACFIALGDTPTHGHLTLRVVLLMVGSCLSTGAFVFSLMGTVYANAFRRR